MSDHMPLLKSNWIFKENELTTINQTRDLGVSQWLLVCKQESTGSFLGSPASHHQPYNFQLCFYWVLPMQHSPVAFTVIHFLLSPSSLRKIRTSLRRLQYCPHVPYLKLFILKPTPLNNYISSHVSTCHSFICLRALSGHLLSKDMGFGWC